MGGSAAAPQRTRKSGLQTKELRAWRLLLRAPPSGPSLASLASPRASSPCFAPAALLAMAARDAASACSADSFQLRHLHLALRVDFGQAGCGSLRGSVRLELTCLRDRASELVLDSHPSVEVQKAGLAPPGSSSCGDAGGDDPGSAEALRPLAFQNRPFASYGSALHITLPEPLTCGDTVVLEIAYRAGSGPGISCLDSFQTAQKEKPFLYTSGFAVLNRSFFPGFHTPAVKSSYSARIQVCWLTPEQTAGKQKPYMYTQGQAVLNRSFFPCFDSPAVKSTYSASIKVPEGFTALMSAITREEQKDNTFLFKMPLPIPSYLVALVVGDIVSAEVGPRSRVWAEPCLIEAAKKEYDGVIEEFLSTGEKLFGPYVWKRYDVLFMPPSFPFGGMENPCITFVTPCLLAGDRSLVDVIIHEISHSWFGNLVTNAHWGEFWLNEGFTTYAQRRISTTIYGAAYSSLEAATGRALLRQHMDNTGEDHPLNKLRVKIEPGLCCHLYLQFPCVDPEDTYNETPYEKGYCFVSYLAHLVGDQSKFDTFLQGKQKYTLPIYRAMANGSETAQELAMKTFSATAPQLHVNVQNYVKKILGLKTE
ncbi:hypothetical protein lerEdw1_016806 [Lerista edwardsae]|nr:hypothetical protein lerEdw1_016806 [Lerista edwardsae]